MNRFVLNETSYHGAGAIQAIATEIQARGFKKALVASDPDLIKFGVTGKVTAVLDNAGIEMLPSDESCDNMHPADAAFLGFVANECGPRPDMHITAIGYGAGGSDTQKANIISAIIGEFESDIFFDAKDYEELTASL